MMTATSKANSSERTTGPLLWRLPSGSLVQGTVADGFEEVAEAFMQGFLDRGEIGASLCIRVDGDVVIDLWGGMADISTGEPWDEDTVSVVFSCTKAAAALCIHWLAARGLLRIDERVSHYWPEFAANGKADVKVTFPQ